MKLLNYYQRANLSREARLVYAVEAPTHVETQEMQQKKVETKVKVDIKAEVTTKTKQIKSIPGKLPVNDGIKAKVAPKVQEVMNRLNAYQKEKIDVSNKLLELGRKMKK